MKAILINDCLGCPLSEIDLRGNKATGGNVRCHTHKGNKRIVGNVFEISGGSLAIPDWCPLENLDEAIAFEKEMGIL